MDVDVDLHRHHDRERAHVDEVDGVRDGVLDHHPPGVAKYRPTDLPSLRPVPAHVGQPSSFQINALPVSAQCEPWRSGGSVVPCLDA